jgi:hypothetical protein
MTKQEQELKLAEIGVQKLQIWLSIPRLVFICLTLLGSIYLIFEGLKPVISQNADAITAFAKVIEALNLGTILSWSISGLASVGYVIERKGKQRAIREKARYQKEAESLDGYRSSSGMNETGTSPRR